MAQKDLIIGAFTNYNYNQLKPWVESIDDCGFTGDKVMVVGNSSQETRDELIKRNFILVDMPQSKIPVYVLRFLSIYEYLRNNWSKYRYVVTTDVKDVYFQTNPMEWLENNLVDKKLVAGSEGMAYKDEPWGNENLFQTYGQYVYEIFKNNEIYNVGTLGGESEYIKDLVFNIFTNATNRPIPIVDQAVYNVLIQTQPYKNSILFAKQYDGWACQAGTTVDPSKIDKFRPFLLEAGPRFVNGQVLTSTGKPFSIVHQYDRVPKWRKYIQQKYKQEDLNQFNITQKPSTVRDGILSTFMLPLPVKRRKR
jgi:hypothetical protein